jgi:hypothetical protein
VPSHLLWYNTGERRRGQRADLTVTFDPDFHATQGPVVRLVWFATNDPTQPWAEVRLTADVL